jgi:hypothetical protein
MVLPPERDPAHGILGDVVIDLKPCVGKEARQSISPLDGVAECLG